MRQMSFDDQNLHHRQQTQMHSTQRAQGEGTTPVHAGKVQMDRHHHPRDWLGWPQASCQFLADIYTQQRKPDQVTINVSLHGWLVKNGGKIAIMRHYTPGSANHANIQ
jgi:hypothetical protein